jgi:argininosuccinate lyase
MSFPVIVKPASYTGSIGVKLCYSIEDVSHHLNDFLNYLPPGGTEYSTSWLIEEYIDGREYSGEFLQGKCIGITQKFKTRTPYFVEIGHVFPAKIDRSKYDFICSTLEKIVHSLGLCYGPLHIEFFLDRNGVIKIVEINGRLPGDRIPILIKNATGMDFFKEYIKYLFGIGKHDKVDIYQYSAIRFKTYKDNKLFANLSKNKAILSDFEEHATSLASCKSNLDRAGFAIMNSDSYDELLTELGLSDYA